MTTSNTEDRPKIRREWSKTAIDLAMAGKWGEAVEINKAILGLFPGDADAYNRLGKALMELGRYLEAREAFGKALQISPYNSIAKKNVERLSILTQNASLAKESSGRVSPRLFLGEMGKTGNTFLVDLAPAEVLAKVTIGDQVNLRIEGKKILVESSDETCLGQLEPKLALRLIKLMEGGNRYASAITSVNGDEAKIIIKEVFQHPSQRGRPSFPTKVAEDFRPYVKSSFLRLEEDEDTSQEEAPEWEEEEATPDEAPFYKEPSSGEEEEPAEEEREEEEQN